MDVVEDNANVDNNDQQKPKKSSWKELISLNNDNKYAKFNARTQVVFDTLREKLKNV